PNRDLDAQTARPYPRQAQRRVPGRIDAKAVVGDAREREPRMAALRDERAVGVDEHVAAIADEPARSDLGALPRDAAAGLDRVDVDRRDVWHRSVFRYCRAPGADRRSDPPDPRDRPRAARDRR